ncbi:lysoplasmalogenase family protein [Phenylobacterium sp.]|uniref:lysoplasmalogenase family protein n=1 Tax=Phenylobacterium sp. TaxID=1871053 RepID=UPI0011F62DD1|nr:lysoplasmalogenase family protein [Phenylobacterium sp.]THD62019.1 MAG: lysoplasmalogenase [Phenylobacterium sp.]
MDRETLANAALAAAVLGGVSYIASWSLPLTPAASLAWKGTGVGFLAVYAALRARSLDGWLLTAVMALGAAGDVLLGAAGQTVGGAVFLAGHLVAIGLYLKNRQAGLGAAGWGFAALLTAVAVWAAFVLPTDRAAAPGIAVYACGGALAAACAGLSRFPRQVALGAFIFLVSDELIFARMGPLAGQAWVGFAVWGLYFAGQALVATGVAQALSAEA